LKPSLNFLRLALVLLILGFGFDAEAESGFLGIQIQGVNTKVAGALGLKSDGGVLIKDVAVGEAGALSGLRRGDLITSFDGNRIRSFQDMVDRAAKTTPGQSLPVIVTRQGKSLTLTLVVGRRPGAWSVKQGAFRNYPEFGFTVAALTKSVRVRFNLPWGTIGLVVTLVDNTKVVGGGLRSGDVIVSANLQPVWHPDQLSRHIDRATAAGREGVLLLIENARGFRYSILPLK